MPFRAPMLPKARENAPPATASYRRKRDTARIAERRASATYAYVNVEQAMPKPPRMPTIPDVEESPPQQSGTRYKDSGQDDNPADYAAKK